MIKYALYDGRYLSDPDSASCYEVVDSIKEARRNKSNYGSDTVIVEETLEAAGNVPNTYMVTNSKIVK